MINEKRVIKNKKPAWKKKTKKRTENWLKNLGK